MKRLTALFLLICMIIGSSACSNPDDNDQDKTVGADTEKNEITDTADVIVVPAYKDYGRGTVNFNELVYSRPNLQAVIESFEAVTSAVTGNEGSRDDQINGIRSLEDGLSAVKTMYSLAQIYHSKDSSAEFWQKEYEYISTNYPRLSGAVEDLLVACALSEHRAYFEENYFEYSLAEYAAGGIYTDEVIELMQEEARLEAEYSSISTSTVEIVYINGTDSWEGTVDEVIAMAGEYYADDDISYRLVLSTINGLYEKKRSELEKPIYVELLKTRRLIADELGYSSYAQLAYKAMGYDYSESDMLSLLGNVGKYTAPVARDLEHAVFYSYLQTNPQPTVSTALVINKLYEVYSELGGDFGDAYSYMLQHGLYDVSKAETNRYDGAFTAYLDTNSSPYIFMSATGFVRDYTTLAHEFGHFLDGYVNYGESSSLAISEISSQALELLTVLKLKGEIRSANYEYLEYYTMSAFVTNVLLEQSFYSVFEHLAYKLEYDDITVEKLENIVKDAAELVYGEEISFDGDLSYVTMSHTVLYPFYVESYVTAGLVSLDIFFAESSITGKAGDGFALYEALINRENDSLTFTEQLESAGLDSPFDDGKVKEISNDIYFQIIGKNYYKTNDSEIGAA